VIPKTHLSIGKYHWFAGQRFLYRPSAIYWKMYIFALSPPALETSWIFHDSSVRYRHIYRFATEIVDIRFLWLQLWQTE